MMPAPQLEGATERFLVDMMTKPCRFTGTGKVVRREFGRAQARAVRS